MCVVSDRRSGKDREFRITDHSMMRLHSAMIFLVLLFHVASISGSSSTCYYLSCPNLAYPGSGSVCCRRSTDSSELNSVRCFDSSSGSTCCDDCSGYYWTSANCTRRWTCFSSSFYCGTYENQCTDNITPTITTVASSAYHSIVFNK